MKDKSRPLGPQNSDAVIPKAGGNLVPGTYHERHAAHWPSLDALLRDIYSDRPDIDQHLSALSELCQSASSARRDDLKELDKQRELEPLWFMSENMVGMTLYVDLFAQNFDGVRAKIPYLVELGITYLHLMPLFKVPPGENDGGYAVSDYRETRKELGDISALRALIDELRDNQIAVAVDFIFNHTADDHRWAKHAKAGDVRYLKYFYSFDDRDIPSAYEQTLREIFPETRRGSFTWNEALRRFVWTTFNSFQWDLNYSNPDASSWPWPVKCYFWPI